MNGCRGSGRVAPRVVAMVALLAAASPVRAEVTRMTITARAPFAGGATFGSVGAYEKIKGVLTYEVDPGSWANGMVFDLEYAPTNARGKVEFTSEFIMLKPVDLSRGNHRLLFEVSRGQYVSQVTQAAHALVKDGLLLAEDADAITARAANMVWPPQPIEAPPFWSQKP